MKPMQLCICSGRQFEETFEKAYKCNQCDFASIWAGDLRTHLKTHSGKKSVQMQPMQLCVCSGRQFEDTFEKSLLRKGIQMQHMRLCINSSRKHLKTPSGDKSFKCIQCNSESRQVGYLRTHLKTHSGKSEQLQPIRLCICSGWRFEKTSENPLR